MSKDKKYVGIDISKNDFDVSFASGKHFKLGNNTKGFTRLLKMLPEGSHCVMEQTGRYHQQIANYLFTHQIPVSDVIVTSGLIVFMNEVNSS